jgi:hypothetical protein
VRVVKGIAILAITGLAVVAVRSTCATSTGLTLGP